jgi:1-acyl-sn-glycerol-3-phosphate acyltransferase
VRRFGAIPVRRGSPAGARQAISAAAEVLLQGGALGIYPEGTRSRDGMLHRGHPGPVRLARATGAALVPVGLVGTSEVQRPGERVPRPFRSIGIRFGEPQRLDEDADLRRATDDLMQEIATLCGQEYVDTFATAG